MATANTEAAILARLIEPDRDDMSEEMARYVLGLTFKPSDQKRMETLAAQAREGTLTDDERAEIENYEHVGHLVALFKSKARRSLRKTVAGT
jgi:hypothetical protein